jgi:uncharacterized glyoxalase superfamily protein PhnB
MTLAFARIVTNDVPKLANFYSELLCVAPLGSEEYIELRTGACVLSIVSKRSIDIFSAAGAEPTVPPFDAFWGDRYGCVTDPHGHVWAIATEQEVLDPAEVDRRMRAFAAGVRTEKLT